MTAKVMILITYRVMTLLIDKKPGTLQLIIIIMSQAKEIEWHSPFFTTLNTGWGIANFLYNKIKESLW